MQVSNKKFPIIIGLGLPLLLMACNGGNSAVSQSSQRIIYAEVVALDQPLTYNRFGSFNPYGMIYALKRDVVDTEKCDAQGRCQPMSDDTRPGHVRLREGKRPRPLVLRVNEGDELVIRFYNMLMPNQPDTSSRETARRIPRTGLDLHYRQILNPERPQPVTLPAEEENPARVVGEAADPGKSDPALQKHYCGWHPGGAAEKRKIKPGNDWPRSRCASITISGVAAINPANGDPSLANGLIPIPPGEMIEYRWRFEPLKKSRDHHRRSTHLFFSHGAPAGGEGDGGSLVHGLFGVVNVEPEGSRWYRSQVDAGVWQRIWKQGKEGKVLDYEAKLDDGTPALNLLRPLGEGGYELVYGDLNAIIKEAEASLSGRETNPDRKDAFREFTVVFHDELKTFYPDELLELEQEFSLSGVRDGFAINYGASGLGAMVLANRKGFGPARDCVECAYEEFFLESWVNGDPALLAEFPDDPSNVHHSYLGDRVIFRNLHAGPKETHVFHLHAHQWLAQDSETGTYLDSQTIAPQQGFSYEIYYGGTGNRNVTPGDSIFHCHLYPHFAQGMWELWRAHDVLEDGTRRLPDGDLKAADGSSGTDPFTGNIPPLAEDVAMRVGPGLSGTPIPAVVPLPGQALLPQPTYGENGFPGYPFYIAGKPGHRTPQAPLDIKEDAGLVLGRHVIDCPRDEQGKSVCARVVSGITVEQQQHLSPDEIIRHALLAADFSIVLQRAAIEVLPLEGTSLEKAAMDFHAQKAIASVTPEGKPAKLKLNGSAPKPGAPFADPCVGWTFESKTFGRRTRRYEVSAIQTDLIVNRAGWHDPQARINVLTKDIGRYENKSTPEAKPFFFRANSGDCIEFHHTNRTHHELPLDDFQVRTPTDTIGQHIHLVKFDVTASDGSGNGFNYEDGTFAREALVERVQAAGNRVFDHKGQSVTLRGPKEVGYQTTIQRWYADPLLARTRTCYALAEKNAAGWKNSPACRDRTIRTVFTHDHFAPSSIQHHGFYAALLVEPPGASLQYPDGSDMDSPNDGRTQCRPGEQDGVYVSCAVGTQAMIIVNDDGTETAGESYREFALAVADFALLYDGRKFTRKDAPRGLKGYLDLKAKLETLTDADEISKVQEKLTQLEALHKKLKKVQRDRGHPVDPPKLPESISKDHHNPYLVNYRHEPLPLRIGCSAYEKPDPGHCGTESIRNQREGDLGDMAYAFSSRAHLDPSTEIFAAYEGERVQLRVIQGAQEVQHMLNIHGHRWPREIGNPDSPLVAAQEIGISEHFEMQLGLDDITRNSLFVDYLYHFGSVDDLWNGAWGFIRSYDSFLDCEKFAKNSDARIKCDAGLASLNCPDGMPMKQCLKPLEGLPRSENGSLVLEGIDELRVGGDEVCPKDLQQGRKIAFYIDTVDLSRWLGHNQAYDDGQLFDPDSLAFVLLKRVVVSDPRSDFPSLPTEDEVNRMRVAAKKRYESDKVIEPLVLRANAGDCIKVALYNQLPGEMDDAEGDAAMPRIVPLNVEGAAGQPGNVSPSPWVTLHPQLVHHNVSLSDGAAVGYNQESFASTIKLQPQNYTWYAGTISIEGKRVVARPRELGPVNLVSFGDVVNHPPHGLFASLIIEPQGASYHDPKTGQELLDGTGVRAEIAYPGEEGQKKRFKEFVVIYRDGLNLHLRREGKTAIPVPDCPVCDDSYDLGEKGINYRSAPFWVRLGQRPQDPNNEGRWYLPDLNGAYYPDDFFTEARQRVPTPRFVAEAGEEVRFRVLQPAGRARQRTFLVYGHDFPDLLPYFGSSHTPLISVGKAITAKIGKARAGHWLYRDGPAQIWAGGAWGVFDVIPAEK